MKYLILSLSMFSMTLATDASFAADLPVNVAAKQGWGSQFSFSNIGSGYSAQLGLSTPSIYWDGNDVESNSVSQIPLYFGIGGVTLVDQVSDSGLKIFSSSLAFGVGMEYLKFYRGFYPGAYMKAGTLVILPDQDFSTKSTLWNLDFVLAAMLPYAGQRDDNGGRITEFSSFLLGFSAILPLGVPGFDKLVGQPRVIQAFQFFFGIRTQW